MSKKIVFCNKEIKNIKYSGFTITKVYGCGGELVYEYQRPTPTNPIARVYVNDAWVEINDDDSNSAVTSGEVNTWLTSSERNSFTVLGLYGNCTSIGADAFSGAGVTSINSWGSVLTIGDNAFRDCNNLETVYYNCNECELVIGESAFQNDFNLTSVTLNAQLIGQYCFYNDYKIKTLSLSADTIGSSAFANCNGLSAVTLSSVETIGNSAFYYCRSLTSITIPSSITSIGNNAFNYCSSLNKIEFKGTTPPTLGSNVFSNTNNCPIVIPTTVSKSTWASGSGWSVYRERLKYPYEI